MSNTTSLKDRYQTKQRLAVTKEKLTKIDEAARQKLNEELDQKLLNNIVGTVKKLQAINFGNMDILDQARDAAVLDVTKTATGDQKKGFMNRVASMLRGDKNPLFDALAFGSAIANFFPQLAQLVEALGSKGGAAVDENQTLADIAQSDEMKNAVKNVITKGLRPSGVLAKMGSGWAKKYLKGSIDELADQIMNTPLKDIKSTAASVKQATSGVTQVAQAAQQRAQQNPQQQPSGDKAASAFEKIQGELGNLDDGDKAAVNKILKMLDNAGLLK